MRIPLDYNKALNKLNTINQTHLLRYWPTLNAVQKTNLLSQIDSININTFKQQQQLLLTPPNTELEDIQSIDAFSLSGNTSDFLLGKKLISEGKVGCLVVAGGQGSRLRYEGPKGMFPVSVVKHKSLFQILAEKVLAASKQAKRPLPIAIMTSPANNTETIQFFKDHQYFGLDSDQISFFPQSTLPLLDTEKNLFLENVNTIALGPDGNGTALQHFYSSGLFLDWHQQGINFINFTIIDNPLADPFDAELVGFHQRQKNDISIKGIFRDQPQEKVGILAKNQHHIAVIEYSEMPDSLRSATRQDGSLLFPCANISLFCFSMDFIKRISKHPTAYHLAFKAVKYLDSNGLSKMADKPIAWKFETFIFDILSFTNKINILIYPRNECFAPLKNFDGENSVQTVALALQSNDLRIFSEISGTPCHLTPFEIAQDFYYPTPELLAKWRGTPAPYPGYID